MTVMQDLQRALKSRGHYQGEVDGDFGPMTRGAVLRAWAAGDLALRDLALDPDPAPPGLNLPAFFEEVRSKFGRLTAAQVAGFETLLAATEGQPLAHRAYLLATAWHETATTMQPITEYGGRRYFDKYDTGRLAAALGNTPAADGDGYLYRGRGYVQITGRTNYQRAGAALGVDLLAEPDAALNPTLAARILVLGATEGWFTGRRLSDYLDGPTPDYRNARRVINGTDRADLIAGYARHIQTALVAAGQTV